LEIEANIDVPLVEAEVGGSSGGQGSGNATCCTILAVIFGILAIGAIVTTICVFVSGTTDIVVKVVPAAGAGVFAL